MALWNKIRHSGLQRLVQSYQNPSFISAPVRSCSVRAHVKEKQIKEPSGWSLTGDITAQYDRDVTDQDYYCFQCRPQHGTGHAQRQIVNALRLGEREKAFGMLQNLGDGNVSLGPDDFSFVLDYCAQIPDPLFVMGTWRIMEEQAVAIDKRCCRAIVKAFSRGGYLKEAFDWLKFVGDNDFAHAMLSLSNIFLSESGSRQSFVDVDHCIELMEKQFVGKSEITYWGLLKMHDLGLKPSGDTYDGFVKAVVYGKGVTYGMKVIESMEKNNIKPYNDTLAVLSTGHSKNFELDIAEALLEKISYGLPKYIHPFNAILAACDIMDQPDRAVHILAKMKHLQIKPNIRTYELLFSLFGNINIPYEKGNMFSHADVSRRINAIEKDMIRIGVQHSYMSMKNLIRALGAEGMIGEMLRYLNIAESMQWNIDPYEKLELYNIVLHAFVKAKETSTAIELFKDMRLSGFPADVATYNMMVECCSILGCLKSASALLSLMLRDGFVPQTLTYNALIKVLLANDDFDSAMSLLDQVRSEENELDIQLFNTILKQANQKGRIDIIELIVELIHKEKIQPNPSTCWYAFCAYVECGFHSTAMEALQVLSLRMISEDENILKDYKAAYEDLLHSEELDVESKIVEIFEESQEFIATALLSLRWCAINGSLISWSPSESLWAKRLSSTHAARRKAG
ncbi:pentatricopeptide repeat-containing protein At1g76280 isoform X2 [Asparagus officinalis]|uniref:pentatricopeptide repeat-containing protein At1g76280 isoform X2 n=1 Tax=Asparagus officinalis TaxID=4686 RepID=UPI00098E39A5|nr:pentatricopeptide repeat-containing protein At1g76280 isoform X2 [Asparagus officinalis]